MIPVYKKNDSQLMEVQVLLYLIIEQLNILKRASLFCTVNKVSDVFDYANHDKLPLKLYNYGISMPMIG